MDCGPQRDGKLVKISRMEVEVPDHVAYDRDLACELPATFGRTAPTKHVEHLRSQGDVQRLHRR